MGVAHANASLPKLVQQLESGIYFAFHAEDWSMHNLLEGATEAVARRVSPEDWAEARGKDRYIVSSSTRPFATSDLS
jgi:hypothetical protein